MQSIFFLSESGKLNTSAIKRCIVISNELKARGYTSEVYLREPLFGKYPNVFAQVPNWKPLLRAGPDVVIIHRSSNIIDYRYVQKLQTERPRTRVIFDYDDALFHVRTLGRMVSYSHLNKLMSRSDAVFAGSHYLVSYAQRYNSNVHLVPSSVDTEVFRPLHRAPDTDTVITIGWLGGATKLTLPGLRLLVDPLNHLSAKHKIRFKMVSALSEAVKAELRQNDFAVSFGLDEMMPLDQKIKVAQEIADFDVGVMPLLDEPFARGKCAMKALEYMAMGIPVVASPVGENCRVVKPGINGFLASTCTEWSNALEMLINDGSLRRAMGKRGRKMVEEEYGVKKIVDRMVCAIEQLS